MTVKAQSAHNHACKVCGLKSCDCLSPALMDAIATHVGKASGVLNG